MTNRNRIRSRFAMNGMITKRHTLYSILAASVLLVAGLVFLVAALRPFVKRTAETRAAFGPLAELRPEILDNAFGVYIVTFTPDSQLTDDTAGTLLSLNRISAESDLTLVIETPAVTDASLPILRKLVSVDRLQLTQSAITPAGRASLRSTLPSDTAGTLQSPNFPMLLPRRLFPTSSPPD